MTACQQLLTCPGKLGVSLWSRRTDQFGSRRWSDAVLPVRNPDVKGLGVPYQLWLPGFCYFDPAEIEQLAMSWVVTELPHLHLLAQRLRSLALTPRELQWWAAPRVCVCRCRVPRPLDRAAAKEWARRIAKVLRELGHHTSARDVSITWSRAFSMTVAFAPPHPDQPGRLIIDLRTGAERVEVWSMDSENGRERP